MNGQTTRVNEINFTDIIKASKCIAPFIRETPLEYSRYYSNAIGASIYLKLENLQLTGSFKIRGAIYSIFSLSKDERANGIVTASSGNHGQGIGFAARELNIPATIVVPKNTPINKIDAIRSYGVDLRIEGDIYDDSERIAHQIEVEEKRNIFLHIMIHS